MGRPMGLDFGLNGDGKFCKRKFRWLFRIDDVCADEQNSSKTLPPQQSARPNLSFKESTGHHLIEEFFYPAKPDWKPINLVLYDLKVGEHPVWKWIEEFYKPERGQLLAPNETPGPTVGFIRTCYLDMLDGCGNTVETWVYEDAWPQTIDFQTLDMGDSNILTVNITLRYMRAYIQPPRPPVTQSRTQNPNVGNV